MFTIFTDPPQIAETIAVDRSKMLYLQGVYRNTLSQIKNYFYNSRLILRNEHILIRLMRTLSVPFYQDVGKMARLADIRGEYVAKELGLISDINKGRILEGQFYSDGPELLIYVNEYFNPYNLKNSWRDLKPLRVLKHPVSNTRLLIPHGKTVQSERGLSVLTIDLTKLIVMYRYFYEERIRIKDAVPDLAEFIHGFVLPNAMDDHLNLVLWNRLKNLHYKTPNGKAKYRLRIHVQDVDIRLDEYHEQVLDSLTKTKTTYTKALKSILLSSSNCLEALLLPSISDTQFVRWVLMLTRLDDIEFIIDMLGDEGLIANRSYINDMKITIRRLQRSPSYRGILPPEYEKEFESRMDKLLKV